MNHHLCVLLYIRTKGEIGTVKHYKSSSSYSTGHSKAVLNLWILLVISCLALLCVAAMRPPAGKGTVNCVLCFSCFHVCSLLPRERADLLALVGNVTFPCGILGQVWYLIVSFSDLADIFTLL